MNAYQVARELAAALGPPRQSGQPLRFMQGVVATVDNQSTCTVVAQGGTAPVGGFRWLFDAYLPTALDVVWIVDGGPGQRFILGVTNGATWRARGPYGIHGEVNGAMTPSDNAGWPFNPLNNGAHPTYNQSPGGAVVQSITFYAPIQAGTYQFVSRALTGPNVGIHETFVNDTSIGIYNGYSAAYASLVYKQPVQVLIPHNQFAKIEIRKLGLKHASSTDYYILWMSLSWGRTALAP